MAERRNNTNLTTADHVSALPRGAEDDFFCHRYKVWYPSFDCAVRTRYRTAPGCLQCDQGRFNEARHAEALARTRFAVPETEESGPRLNRPCRRR